jgi:hypothetical protein
LTAAHEAGRGIGAMLAGVTLPNECRGLRNRPDLVVVPFRPARLQQLFAAPVVIRASNAMRNPFGSLSKAVMRPEVVACSSPQFIFRVIVVTVACVSPTTKPLVSFFA